MTNLSTEKVPTSITSTIVRTQLLAINTRKQATELWNAAPLRNCLHLGADLTKIGINLTTEFSVEPFGERAQKKGAGAFNPRYLYAREQSGANRREWRPTICTKREAEGNVTLKGES